jgi:hypothetical protein
MDAEQYRSLREAPEWAKGALGKGTPLGKLVWALCVHRAQISHGSPWLRGILAERIRGDAQV